MSKIIIRTRCFRLSRWRTISRPLRWQSTSSRWANATQRGLTAWTRRVCSTLPETASMNWRSYSWSMAARLIRWTHMDKHLFSMQQGKDSSTLLKHSLKLVRIQTMSIRMDRALCSTPSATARWTVSITCSRIAISTWCVRIPRAKTWFSMPPKANSSSLLSTSCQLAFPAQLTSSAS